MANRFLNNITINDAYTFPDNDGTNGQAIVTDGAGNLTFGSVAAASAESAESIHIPVKNTSGSQILKGTPVYITGETGNSGKIEIAPADASSASTMPCLGLLESTLSNNAEGFCVQSGLLEGLSTATIDGASANANDTVYVKSGGGLTLTKPTGTGLIQNIAKVARTHASNGSLVVSAILRTNDVPNLPSGKIWVGDDNTTVSTVVFIDETNNYFGLNNVVPAQALDVTGNILASGSIEGDSIIKTGGVSTEFLKADGSVDSSTYLSSIPNSGVASGQYGDASNIPQITIGADGRITSATDVAVNIPAGTTVGTAGNEVSGTVTLQGGGDTTVTQSGQTITISSTSSGGGGGELSIERDVITATANQQAFTISSDITASSNTQVYIDGVYQAKSNYTTSGSVITFSTGVPAGAEVEVVHFISVLSKVYTDTFTGNASTVDFTASKDVSDENVTQVYIDGVYQSKDNYTTSGTTITFSTAPPSGSAIEVVHFTAATYSTLNSNQFTGTGSQTDFTLTQAVDVDTSFVFIQGVYQEKDQYSISGTTLTFVTAPLSGYSIEVVTVGTVANVTSSPVNSVNGLTGDVTVSGGTDWQSTPKTADFTAVSGEGYFVDTTSTAITVTLPSSPSVGDEVGILDYASNAATNNITIDPGTLNFRGATDDLVLSTNNQSARLIYSGATKGWLIFTEAGGIVAPLPDLTVDYLVVAGGGGGGGPISGGGGAGGLRTSYGSTQGGGQSSESSLTLDTSTNYTVTVGGGGSGGFDTGVGGITNGSNGVNSVFSTIISIGGGTSQNYNGIGIDGGSGGGSPRRSTTNWGDAVTSPVIHGYRGGGGSTTGGTDNQGSGGGGGGAGSVGGNASGSTSGTGGSGLAVSITGSSVAYAGGGGGGAYNGTGGSGTDGGGNGSGGTVAATNGSPNIGAGGGAGGFPTTRTGGDGGSGVVILRYPSAYTISETTSAQLTFTTATDGSDKVTVFTGGDGTIEFTT